MRKFTPVGSKEATSLSCKVRYLKATALSIAPKVCADGADGANSANGKASVLAKAWTLCIVCLLAITTGCQSLSQVAQTRVQRIHSARDSVSEAFNASRNGSLSDAKRFFQRASKELPTDYRIVANLARTHYKNGEVVQAITEMQRAVDMSSGDSELHVELGEYQLAAGRWLQAQRSAEIGLEKNHKLASAWFLRGKTKSAKGDYQGALNDYQRAIGFDQNREDIQMQIAAMYGRLKKPMRSLAAVEQLLSRYPPDALPESAVIAKSVALMDLQQLEPAIEILEVASRSHDASSDVFMRLGQAQLLAGQPSQARLTLARAQQTFPAEQQFDRLAQELKDSGERVAAINQ